MLPQIVEIKVNQLLTMETSSNALYNLTKNETRPARATIQANQSAAAPQDATAK